MVAYGVVVLVFRVLSFPPTPQIVQGSSVCIPPPAPCPFTGPLLLV